jgi:hypothetical protein
MFLDTLNQLSDSGYSISALHKHSASCLDISVSAVVNRLHFASRRIFCQKPTGRFSSFSEPQSGLSQWLWLATPAVENEERVKYKPCIHITIVTF